MKKAISVVLATLLSLGLIIGGGIYSVNLLLKPDQFDQDRWFAQPEERVEMVTHLLSNVKLKGMPKEEIIDLLGKQEEDVYFKEQNNLVYYLGAEPGLPSIDSAWLIIWFDGDNKVIDFEVATD
jgi:hypothetical protein